MPIVRLQSTAPTVNGQEASAPPDHPSGLRNMGGALVRLLGGFVSNAGGWPGALAGAGSELGAELIEGSFDPFKTSTYARIGTEAGIGMVPLHGLITGGKTLKTIGASALKSGAFSGAGDIGRQIAEQYDPETGLRGVSINPGRAAFATTLGAITGGALGPLAPTSIAGHEMGFPRKAPRGPEPYGMSSQPQPTVTSNSGEVLRPRAIPREPRVEPAYNTSGVNNSPDPTQMPDWFEAPDQIGRGRTPYNSPEGVDNRVGGPPQVEDPRAASMARNLERDHDAGLQENRLRDLARTLGLEIPAHQRAMTVGESTINQAQRAADESSKFDELSQLFDMENPSGTMTERAKSGNQTITMKYGFPEEEGMEGVTRGGNGGGRGPASTPPGVNVEQIMASVPPDADQIAAAARRGPLGLYGEPNPYEGHPGPLGYGQGLDEVPKGPYDDYKGPVGYGSSEKGPYDDYPGPLGYGASERPKFPTTPNADPEQEGLQALIDFLGVDAAYGAAKEAGDVASTKSLGGIFGRTQARAQELNAPALNPKSEKGMATAELLLTAAGAVAGGAFGASQDQNGSPIEGAITGALAGASLPHIPKLLATVNLSPEVLNNPQGIREAAQKIVKQLPMYQRAAYLMDSRGLIPNIVLGPWGSMMTSALEAGLSGDPRGWQVIREGWNIANFVRHDMPGAMDEAMELVRRGELGRAEGIEKFGMNVQTGLSGPGVGMTVGDVAARRKLMAAGFSPDEARAMTLTGEPAKNTLAHNIVNFGRDNTLANMIFPFRRTPANIMSSGSDRLPGLGALKQLYTGSGVSGRQLAVQQGLGLASGYAGYKVGQQLDDPRSRLQGMASRSVSNLAGRYGMPASLGLLLGRTVGQGKNFNYRNMSQAVENSIPLPSVTQMIDIPYYLASKAGLTASENPKTPRVFPFQELASESEEPMLRNLSALRLR